MSQLVAVTRYREVLLILIRPGADACYADAIGSSPKYFVCN
jgi:hypothetical protein